MDLFFNSKESIFEEELKKNTNSNIKIASAFFSNSGIIEYFLANNCKIEMIIRLNKGTSPKALRKIADQKNQNLKIRFFTSERFPPKFYIFNSNIAYIGSSNLTNNGLSENQEMNIKIEETETIEQLVSVFDAYWEQAEELTENDIKKFEKITEKNKPAEKDSFSEEIKKEFGEKMYKEADFDFSNANFKFYNTGEGECRNFDDYVKYGFISAGQRRPDKNHYFSDEIKRFKKGDYFFAYWKSPKSNVKKRGYVGFGKILEEAVPVDNFKVDGVKISELVKQNKLTEPNIMSHHDDKECEWLCKVKWIKTFTRENAAVPRDIDQYAFRNTVCSIPKEKHSKLLDFLLNEFCHSDNQVIDNKNSKS